MHAGTREKLYTEGIGVKVTPDVDRAINAAAEASGISKMVWIRGAIEQALRPVPTNRMVLAEVLALREILVTVTSPEWREKGYTEAELSDLIRDSDADKFGYVDAAVATGMER